nr:MAG TPA: hypothetical protein [Caudoviricetes sp.]
MQILRLTFHFARQLFLYKYLKCFRYYNKTISHSHYMYLHLKI